MSDIQERSYSAEDLLRMAEDGKRYELIGGALIERSSTAEPHGVLSLAIGALIWAHVRANQLGRVYGAENGFIVATNPDTVLAPDAAFVSAERAKPLTQKFGPGAPDLAVEVVSPGNTAGELNEKTALYFQAGTRQVWVIYPKTRTVHVCTSATTVQILTQSDTLEGGPLLPGFSLPIADLFKVLDD